jgi:hypothetical protein
VTSRQTGQGLWDQVVRMGLDLGARMSSQDRAVSNARAATTELSRARVERDAVELYLTDREEERLASEAGDARDDAGIPAQCQERA